MAGHQLGVLLGTAVSWFGMTLGAVAGFELSRRFGKPLARWLADDGDIESMRRLNERTGPMLLVMTRAVPVLAEASVVLVGVNQLSWRRFLPPILFGNFVISLAYAGFGKLAAKYDWFLLAVIVSIVIPVLTSIAFKRFLTTQQGQNDLQAGTEEDL